MPECLGKSAEDSECLATTIMPVSGAVCFVNQGTGEEKQQSTMPALQTKKGALSPALGSCQSVSV